MPGLDRKDSAMQESTDRLSAPHLRGSTPLPWYVFNEFWYVIGVSIAATFGPDRAHVAKHGFKVVAYFDAPQTSRTANVRDAAEITASAAPTSLQ